MSKKSYVVILKKVVLFISLMSLCQLKSKDEHADEYIFTDYHANIKELKSAIGISSSKQGFHKTALGLKKNEKVVAYVDANNDKYTDLITYIQDTEAVYFYIKYYRPKKGTFENDDEAPIFNITEKGVTITNVYAGSFNPDGNLGFIVSLRQSTGIKDNYIFTQSDSQYTLVKTLTDTNIIIADIDGDRNLEVIYNSNTNGYTRYVLKLTSDDPSSFSESPFENYLYLEKNCSYGTQFINSNITDDFGNAFIDIDADCKNDLLISSRSTVKTGDGNEDDTTYRLLEIYEGMVVGTDKPRYASRKYCLRSNGIIKLENLSEKEGKSDFGPFSVGDLNDDGYIDIIFPKLNSNMVAILFNKVHNNHKWSDNYCSKSWANPGNKLDFNKTYDSVFVLNSDYYLEDLTENLVIKNYDGSVDKGYGGLYELNAKDTTKQWAFYTNTLYTHTSIRLGDYKSSAYPGIITLMQEVDSTKEENDKEIYMRLFKNYFRTFANKTEPAFKMSIEYKVKNPLYVSFFDLEENGQLDLLIVSDINKDSNNDYDYDYDNENNQTDSDTMAFYGNFYFDSFFVKAYTYLNNGKLYSTEIGTNYRFIATENNNGNRRLDVTFQLAQCTDMNLNIPYALAGIGRSNNYIEYFNVISNSLDYFYEISKKKNNDNNTFSPIIPNTQMLIKKTYSKKNIYWDAQLFVNPANNMWILAIIIACVCIALLIIIIILQVKENKEDKKQEENFAAWFA